MENKNVHTSDSGTLKFVPTEEIPPPRNHAAIGAEKTKGGDRLGTLGRVAETLKSW